MSDPRSISPAQVDFARVIAKRLHLPERMLDDHCVKRFGLYFQALSVRQGSELIEEMLSWEQLPADFQRAKGQADLPGFG